jgi:hypothetical protein
MTPACDASAAARQKKKAMATPPEKCITTSVSGQAAYRKNTRDARTWKAKTPAGAHPASSTAVMTQCRLDLTS